MLSYSAAGNAAQWQAPLAQATRVAARMQVLQQACQQHAGMDAFPALTCLCFRVLGHRHTCSSCSSSSDSGSWWHKAGPAELQLCQSGLQQFLSAVGSALHPVSLFRCLQALDTAVSEYVVACSQDQVMGFSSFSALSLDPPGQGLAESRAQTHVMRSAMHTELLRALHWCFWLLGVE